MKSTLQQEFAKMAEALYDETVQHRRHLHQYPELSFQENATADFVEKVLIEIGFTSIKRMAKTGVVALLHPQEHIGKVIGLRSDLDALPIQETNVISYKSKHEGVMHACGHDVHTAILLTVAKILFRCKDQVSGNVKFIFQPGEELLPGGASVLIKEGVLNHPNVDYLIAQHVTPQIPVGKIGFKKGLFMASTDEIYITVKGKGGHAAMPHTYVNPLLLASEILMKLNQFFMIDKTENSLQIPTVLAFGKINGAGATNVIPDEVNIAGTFRTLDETWRKKAHLLIKEIAARVASNMNGECEVDIHFGYPCLVNDEEVTTICMQSAEQMIGKGNIQLLDYRMTAEDFAYFSQIKPVCFYRLGTGNAQKDTEHNVHNSNFNIDEDVLRYAPAVMAAMAIDLMN
jgi:amidohydrolase